MGLIAKNTGGGDHKPPPEGTHTAICVKIIDIGTQYSNFYGKSKHKVIIGWELPNAKDDEGEPVIAWKRYTLSLHENAALRGHLEAWRGKSFSNEELEGFHLKNILGKLHTKNRSEAVAYAARVGYLDVGQHPGPSEQR